MSEDVFVALADPTRRAVLDLLATRGEGTATSLAAELPVSRVAVIKHLAVLDRAGLVEARRSGRELLYRVNIERLDRVTRSLSDLAEAWDRRLARIKRLAEAAVRERDARG